MKTLAVLLTCYNRKAKTLSCLEYLFRNEIPETYSMSVFLVDDGSTDGTTVAVKDSFPEVNIIKGTGELYWNQGMRLAWQEAINTNTFDFFIWLNDDTELKCNAISQLLDTYHEIVKETKREAIVTGACQESKTKITFSYGGRTDNGAVIPNNTIQLCKYINGNIVLVPKDIYNTIGILSNDYTHGMGDYDYGLRAQENGFLCVTTKEYVAYCETHKRIATWCNPEKTLAERKKSFISPLGLNIKEYLIFRKKFWPNKWFWFMSIAYVKLYFPKWYKTIKEL